MYIDVLGKGIEKRNELGRHGVYGKNNNALGQISRYVTRF